MNKIAIYCYNFPKKMRKKGDTTLIYNCILKFVLFELICIEFHWPKQQGKETD